MAEKRTIELEITTNEKSLKSQLREAQAEVAKLAEKFGATSDQAVKAAKKAAELKDAIADAKNLTDAYNPDAKFNALSTSIGGVLNGFQAYEGALGVIGVESEDLQKTLLKVQSAMALTQGLNGILEAKESFINLGKQVTSVGSTAINAFKSMSTAAKAFAVTGIGLLITAIGLIVANWDSVSKAIGLSNEEQKKFEKQQKAINEEAKKQREEVAKQSSGFATLIAQLKTTNANSKERIELINKINAQYGTTLKNIKDEKKFQEQLNTELASYLEYQRQKYKLQRNEELIQKNLQKQEELTQKILKLEQTKDKVIVSSRRASASGAQSIIEDEQATQAQREKTIEQIKNLKQELDDTKKRFENYGAAANKAQGKLGELSNEGKKYSEQSTENATTEIQNITQVADLRDQIYEEEIKQIQDLNAQQQIKLIVDAENRMKEVKNSTATEEQKAELTKLIQENLNKDLENLDAEYYAKDEAAKQEANDLKIQQENDYLDQIEQLQEENHQNTLTDQEREVQAVNDKYFALEEAAKGNAEQLAIIEEAKQNELDKIDEEYAEKAKARQKELNDKKIQGISDTLTTVSNLAELFAGKSRKSQENAFKVQKAAQIAQATIDTYKSATGAFSSLSSIPVVGPALGAAAAAAAITAGLLNVKKIASQKFDGGDTSGGGAPSSGGGGAVGGGGVAAPSFNVVGSSGVNQLAQIQSQPTRAYVVSGDVANGLSLERNRLQNATL